MIEFLSAIGLVFVIEGAMYALFPVAMKNMAERMIILPAAQLRAFGLAFAIFGFIIIGVLRGF